MSTTDQKNPVILPGGPCWMDLMTSDPDKSIAFYTSLFGWEHHTPEGLDGYTYFTKNGKAVGGAMKNQSDWNAPDGWSIFLQSDDVRATAKLAQENGATVVVEPMDVEPNGSFVILKDPGGAMISAWQAGTETGFGVMFEDGAPVHFELHTRKFDKSLDFYRKTFGWKVKMEADTPEFRYALNDEIFEACAGVMDATAFLPAEVAPHWSVYISVDNVEATIAKAVDLGGATTVFGPDDTPYGRLATISDATGAMVKLRSE